MIYRLLKRNTVLAFSRNVNFAKSAKLSKILNIIIGVVVALYLVSVGFVLSLLDNWGEDASIISVIDLIFPYFVCANILIKIFFKKWNNLDIEPYLRLPIKYNKLYAYILIRESYSFWNFYSLFLWTPIVFLKILPEYGILGVFPLFLGAYLLELCSTLVVAIFQSFKQQRLYIIFLVPLFICGLILLFAFNFFEFPYFSFILFHPIETIIWIVVITVGLIILNRLLFRRSIYWLMESDLVNSHGKKWDFNLFFRFGEVGMMMDMRIKRALRTKRMKELLFLTFLLMMISGLLLYINQEFPMASTLHKEILPFVIYLSFIGSFGITFGNYIVSAESTYFDLLITRPFSLFRLIQSEYLLLTIISFVICLFICPFLLYNGHSLLSLISMFCSVIGLLYPILFQCAAYSNKRHELYSSAWKNYESNSLVHYLIPIPSLGIPIAIYIPISIYISESIANYIMIMIGVLAFISQKYWIQNICNRFNRRKYKNIAGFRYK